MSDSHDHPHSHPPHDHGGPEHRSASPSAAPGAPGGEDVVEDSSTQALGEALRHSFLIIKVIMIGLLIAFLFSGLFKVEQQERAVLLRFGVPVGGGDGKLWEPGLHWAFPPPIDRVVRIPVGQFQSVASTVGWYATTPAAQAAGTEPPPRDSLHPVDDGYLLTGDENIIHAKATLRYRIAEPGLRYVLDFANASNVVQNAFNNALLYAAARSRVDDILTRDQAGFREMARSRLEHLAERLDLGITEIQIDDMQVIPPRQLKEPFARVSEAEVVRGKELNEARTYENQTISRARADAEARKNEGEAERIRLVEFVAAEVDRFTNNLPAYRANPELFVQQRRADSLRVVFANAQEKIAAFESQATNKTLWLQINRDLPKLKEKEPDKPKDVH